MKNLALQAAIALVISLAAHYGLDMCKLTGCQCKTTDMGTVVKGCCCGDKCDCCVCCGKGKAPATSAGATYADAKKRAQDNGKPILILFHASWCGPCKQMEKTYADAEVVKALKEFSVYHCDIDTDKECAKKFMVKGIPAYAVVDPNTDIAAKQASGFKTPRQFLKWLPCP